jgi:hypothetical protein
MLGSPLPKLVYSRHPKLLFYWGEMKYKKTTKGGKESFLFSQHG